MTVPEREVSEISRALAFRCGADANVRNAREGEESYHRVTARGGFWTILPARKSLNIACSV